MRFAPLALSSHFSLESTILNAYYATRQIQFAKQQATLCLINRGFFQKVHIFVETVAKQVAEDLSPEYLLLGWFSPGNENCLHPSK